MTVENLCCICIMKEKKPSCLSYKPILFCFSYIKTEQKKTMAVNSESTNKEIEKQEEKEIGKQKDGSLVCAENDWCLNFVANLPWADTNNALRYHSYIK